MARCPVCGSPITTDTTEIQAWRDKGVYVWTNDPLRTPLGLAGSAYKGQNIVRWYHVRELQEARIAQEELAGIPTGERTNFHIIARGAAVEPAHILELRDSTEKILDSLGTTKEYYFNYDEEGNEINSVHQTDWIDINLVKHHTPVNAIHIEDLRHHISFALFKLWIVGSSSDPTYHNYGPLLAAWCENGIQQFSYQFIWVYHTVTVFDGSCCTQNTIGPGGVHGNTQTWENANSRIKFVNGAWSYKWHPDYNWWNPLGHHSGGKVRKGVNYYLRYNTAKNYRVTLLAKPIDASLPKELIEDMSSYEVQEWRVDPVLVNETYGYPVEIDRITFEYTPKPKAHSCGFLEDASFGGYVHTLGRLEYSYGGEKVAFRGSNLPVTQISSGTPEEILDWREINYWDAFYVPPLESCAAQLMGGMSQFWSITRRGIKYCNSYILYVPVRYGLQAGDTERVKKQKLKRYKERMEQPVQLTRDRLKWNLNMTRMVGNWCTWSWGFLFPHCNEYDPGGTPPGNFNHEFRGYLLLAKDDGVEFVAEHKDELSKYVNSSMDSIYLVADTIAHSVELEIEGTKWTRVDYSDLGNYTSSQKIFAVDSNTLYFSGGDLGNRISNSTTASITVYSKPIPYHFYASGYVVLDVSDAEKDRLEGTTAYMMLNYYNIPTIYPERQSPIIHRWQGDKIFGVNRYYNKSIRSIESAPGPLPPTIGYLDHQLEIPPITEGPLRPTAIYGEEDYL
jgi:hypothetical protein